MEIFFTLLFKMIPLYALIVLWFLSVKILKVEKESIAKLLIYIIAPIVIFLWTYSAEITLSTLSLPLLFFVLCSIISLLFLRIWTIVYGKGNTLKNILAFTTGTWNTGYFGLPVIYALFWEEIFSLAVLSILWFILYENTLWFFIIARGSFSLKQSIYKVLKLPTIYAFIFWVVLNLFQVEISNPLISVLDNFKWAYIVFWMMIIWMWLWNVQKLSCDFLFTWLSLFAKFCIFPLFIFFITLLDRSIFLFFNEEIYSVMIVMAIVPLAANTVALAVEFQTHPEKITITVLISTIVALFYIPFVVSLFL